MSFLPPNEQLTQLKKGVVDVISEKELWEKLNQSFLENKPLRIKAGFDPSRPDLHLGHTVILNKMRQFQKLGHHVLFVIGDFTGLIGDPSGRNETRPQLSSEEVKANAQTYARQVFKVLDQNKTEVIYNSTWINSFKPGDFLKLQSQYTVARMLEREDFTQRFKNNQPISLHEFLYPLLQGYDSVALKADVELGGTDQRFNLLVGRELQKSYGQKPQVVITIPLLEGLDGVQKMSKSYDNYIALEDSPREIFGKTMRVSDQLMWRYYELLTDETVEKLEQMKKEVAEGKLHPRSLKVDLAKKLVERFHSTEGAQMAHQEFERIFVDKGLPDEMPQLNMNFKEEIWVGHLFTQAGLVSSTSEVRRLVLGGAIEIDGTKIVDPQLKLKLSVGKELILKAGKKKFAKVKVI
ncbi:MAG: tyrosine--tRNA ligase [Bdellovibrionales bacterium]|nr:tyrosine--tRNA ligase [Bdellovibrionales bacterium]